MRGERGVWRSGVCLSMASALARRVAMDGQRTSASATPGFASVRSECRQRGEVGGIKQAQGYAGGANAAPGDPSPNAIPAIRAAAGAAVCSPPNTTLGCRQCPRPFSPAAIRRASAAVAGKVKNPAIRRASAAVAGQRTVFVTSRGSPRRGPRCSHGEWNGERNWGLAPHRRHLCHTNRAPPDIRDPSGYRGIRWQRTPKS